MKLQFILKGYWAKYGVSTKNCKKNVKHDVLMQTHIYIRNPFQTEFGYW